MKQSKNVSKNPPPNSYHPEGGFMSSLSKESTSPPIDAASVPVHDDEDMSLDESVSNEVHSTINVLYMLLCLRCISTHLS